MPSEPGNERMAIDQVAEAVAGLGLDEARLERLKTAVGEATMNAIEHGNQNRPELPVEVSVVADEASLTVRITDQGGERPLPEVETPDLEAKLAGLQTRGAGACSSSRTWSTSCGPPLTSTTTPSSWSCT